MRQEPKVSFRLREEEAEQGDRLARQVGMSRGKYAQLVFRQHLDGSRDEEMRSQILRLRAELGQVLQELHKLHAN